jgi:hypothetical protein
MTEGSAEAVCKLMLTKPVCVNIGMGGIVMCFAAAYHRKFNKRLTWNQLKELHNIVFLAPRLNNLHRSGYSLDDFKLGGSLHVAFDEWLAQNTGYLAFCAALGAPPTFDFIREGFDLVFEKFQGCTMKFFEFCHWLLMQSIRDVYADDPDCGFLLKSSFEKQLDQDDLRFMSETLLHRISTMSYHLGQQFWLEVHPYAIWSAIETLAPIMAVLTGSSTDALLGAAREGKGDLVMNVRYLFSANLSQAGVLLEPSCFNATIVQGMVNCVETTLDIDGDDAHNGACLLVWALLTARLHDLKKNLLNDINRNGGEKFKELLTGIIAESTGDLLSAREAIFERCQRPFSYTRGEAWIIRW